MDQLEHPETIPTSRGPMTGAQICDELRYNSYAHNRGLGLSAERLAGFFGEEPGRVMEERYRSEHREVESEAEPEASMPPLGAIGEPGSFFLAGSVHDEARFLRKFYGDVAAIIEDQRRREREAQS